MKKKLTILFAALLCVSFAFAQEENNMLRYKIPMNPTDTQRLMFSFSNLDFVDNYEYFNPIQAGYTLFGYLLNPRLAYMPNKYLRIEGGILVRKDYGNNNYTIVQPTFTVKASSNGYSMLIGNTEGTFNHRLIEPIWDKDNGINYPLENGGQFLMDKKRIWADVFIDWQKAIYPGVAFQEQIWAGASSRITVAGANKALKFIIPIQGIIWHHGGQIESDTADTRVISLFNFATGGILEWDAPSKNNFIQQVRTDDYWVYYHDVSHTPGSQPLILGSGTYLNASVKTKYFLEAMLSYWNGNNFVAPRGAPLFQSIATPYSAGNDYLEKNRQLLFLRLMYEQQWFPDFYVGIRFEPYYDLNLKVLEYSYSFWATYRKDFSLAKIKRKKWNTEE